MTRDLGVCPECCGPLYPYYPYAGATARGCCDCVMPAASGSWTFTCPACPFSNSGALVLASHTPGGNGEECGQVTLWAMVAPAGGGTPAGASLIVSAGFLCVDGVPKLVIVTALADTTDHITQRCEVFCGTHSGTPIREDRMEIDYASCDEFTGDDPYTIDYTVVLNGISIDIGLVF